MGSGVMGSAGFHRRLLPTGYAPALRGGGAAPTLQLLRRHFAAAGRHAYTLC